MLGVGIVQLFDEEDPFRSDTTLLAAALLTLGIPQVGPRPNHAVVEAARGERKPTFVWNFADASRDRRFSTVTLKRAWSDGSWLLANAVHPLAIMRGGLTYARAMTFAPRYSVEYRSRVETPDTWLETAVHNLLILLRDMPATLADARGIIRFAPRHAALVPASLSEKQKTEFIRYVEYPAKRPQLRTAA